MLVLYKVDFVIGDWVNWVINGATQWHY